MSQLINKGGFRERANRSRTYKESENKKTTLISNKYQPDTKINPDAQESTEPNSQQNKNQTSL